MDYKLCTDFGFAECCRAAANYLCEKVTECGVVASKSLTPFKR